MSEPTSPSVGPSPPASSFMASSSPAPPSPATEYHDEADDSAQSEKKKTKKKQPKALEYPTDIPRLTKLVAAHMASIPAPSLTELTGASSECLFSKSSWRCETFPALERRPNSLPDFIIGKRTPLKASKSALPSPTLAILIGSQTLMARDANGLTKLRTSTPMPSRRPFRTTCTSFRTTCTSFRRSIRALPATSESASRSKDLPITCILSLLPSETTAITSNKISNCKHVIYVLTHVFRAPAELLPQKTLFTKELEKLIADAPKVLPTQSEVDNDPSFKDGKPKSKDGKSCAVCYKDFAGDSKTVCCAMCGHHIHSGCFDVYARQTSGWGTKCAVCQASWAAM